MMVFENKSLKALNTFGMDIRARYFAEVGSDQDVKELKDKGYLNADNVLILGGGSNILFLGDYDGMVVRVINKGIQKIREDEQHVWLACAAGEIWDEVVEYAVNHGWGGLENLSLIPGTVGASPIQNIGAYGSELQDVFEHLEAISLETGEIKVFRRHECRFGYRDSIFKQEAKGQYLIMQLVFRLKKHPVPNLSYKALQDEVRRSAREPDIRTIRNIVCEVRRSKLPDPALLGNAGSFFKNPTVRMEKWEEIKSKYPTVVCFEQEGTFKLAAAWLIDQCGWKGEKVGNVGVHENQPLVLVNYGNAKGREVLDLAEKIKDSVLNKFGVNLEMEVNIVG